MMDQVDELFIELNNTDELKQIPSILILDLPNETDLERAKLQQQADTDEIYVFATTLVSNGYLEIKVNTEFDVIFPKKEPQQFLACNAVLKYVNVNPKYEIDYLPGGSVGICLLKFAGGKPDMLNKLSRNGDEKSTTPKYKLVLTQKKILDKLE